MNILQGWKTYIAGFGFMLKAAIGFALHFADPQNALALPMDQAFNDFMTGLGLVGLRKAITPNA